MQFGLLHFDNPSVREQRPTPPLPNDTPIGQDRDSHQSKIRPLFIEDLRSKVIGRLALLSGRFVPIRLLKEDKPYPASVSRVGSQRLLLGSHTPGTRSDLRVPRSTIANGHYQ